MSITIQNSLLIVALLFIQCADSSPTAPNNIPDLNPVLLEKTKIVFNSASSRPPIADIYIISPDGSNQLNISNTAQYVERSPTWSPDGLRIIFKSNEISPYPVSDVGERPKLKMEILSMAADGSNRKQEIDLGRGI